MNLGVLSLIFLKTDITVWLKELLLCDLFCFQILYIILYILHFTKMGILQEIVSPYVTV
jgi:hypothetical protein